MKNNRGFTLIELLAIIVILAVIMAIAIPQVLNVVNGSKRSAWKDNIKMMAKSIELNTQLFDAETGNYTYTVDSLCKNPSKVNDLSKSSDTTVTCSNGVFTISGIGQFDGFYASIRCTNSECNPNVFSENNKFCELKSGKALAVGSKYECDPGDGTKRNFYVLTVNSNTVDLIMERNLSDTVGSARTMTYNDAMAYFTTGAGASTKAGWKNVINVDLPGAEAIAKAVGNNDWVTADKIGWWCLGSKDQDLIDSYCNAATNEPYAWLFDYLIGCKQAGCNTAANATAYGYWTKDLSSSSDYAYSISWAGSMSKKEVSTLNSRGVRPVITVLKSSLN